MLIREYLPRYLTDPAIGIPMQLKAELGKRSNAFYKDMDTLRLVCAGLRRLE